MARSERRRVSRVTLNALASLGAAGAEIVNLSLSGARLESSQRFVPGSQTVLSFSSAGALVKISAKIERCRLDRFSQSTAVYDVGISFPIPQQSIAEVVATELSETMRRQKANAAGVVPMAGPSFGEQLAERLTRRTGAYLRLTLEKGLWTSDIVASPRQPESGFTVDAGERQEQVALLQRTYAAGDGDTRRMIARLAALTISVAAVVEARAGSAA